MLGLDKTRTAARAPARAPDWDSRGKLLAMLAGAAAVAALLLGGLGLFVYYATQSHRATAAGHSAAASPAGTATATAAPAAGARGARDALADRPMPTAATDAAQPGPVSARDPGEILLPHSTRTGPVRVPAGYPHTPAGALAQLAAIDQAALQSGSLDGDRAVIASWAAPGGPTPQTWSGVTAMAQFLTAAGLSGGGSPRLALVVTPLMGIIKGSIGPDFTVACVDLEVDATLRRTRRVAAADCQRMVWRTGRWVIGPGPEPSQAASVWPDTDTAIRLGWKDLRHA